MREYETVYITQPELEDGDVGTITDKVKGICSKDGAHLLNLKDWGVRKMAYEINKKRRGRYFLVNFVADGAVVPEPERNFRIDENVMRFHTIQLGDVADVQARIQESLSVAKLDKAEPVEAKEG
jgi:small subunit ribosomal protein S6